MKKSKRIKKSNSWRIKQHRDQFFKKSKILGFRSRASFKLIELNNKFKFIKRNSYLLDLGSCPGSWAQVASQIIKNGKIMSIDIKTMEPVNNVKFFKGDILEKDTKAQIRNYFNSFIDVILSDMAADTTGSKSLDSIRTNQLCADVINFSKVDNDLHQENYQEIIEDKNFSLSHVEDTMNFIFSLNNYNSEDRK